jgi:hypothetical protein
LFQSSNHHGFWEKWRREEGGEVLHGLRQEWVVNDRVERRRGVKEDSFYCGPTGWRRASPVRPVTGTGQTGDRRWSRQRALIGFSDRPSVEPKILIKFNREFLSVEPTRPR